MHKNKINYNQKGITLLTLVVTIIIILILAGVAISAVTGENSIIEKAKLAAEQYEDAENNEKTAMEKLEEQIKSIESSGSSASGGEISGEQLESLKGILEELKKGHTSIEGKISELDEKVSKITLGEGSKNIKLLKSLVGNGTIDVSNEEGYENFTESNFIVELVSIPDTRWRGNSSFSVGYGCSVVKTYSDGILEIKGLQQAIGRRPDLVFQLSQCKILLAMYI